MSNHEQIDKLIKACPFCGSDVDIEISVDVYCDQWEIRVSCQELGNGCLFDSVFTLYGTVDRYSNQTKEGIEDEIIKLWNNRPVEDAQAARIKELEAKIVELEAKLTTCDRAFDNMDEALNCGDGVYRP